MYLFIIKLAAGSFDIYRYNIETNEKVNLIQLRESAGYTNVRGMNIVCDKYLCVTATRTSFGDIMLIYDLFGRYLKTITDMGTFVPFHIGNKIYINNYRYNVVDDGNGFTLSNPSQWTSSSNITRITLYSNKLFGISWGSLYRFPYDENNSVVYEKEYDICSGSVSSFNFFGDYIYVSRTNEDNVRYAQVIDSGTFVSSPTVTLSTITQHYAALPKSGNNLFANYGNTLHKVTIDPVTYLPTDSTTYNIGPLTTFPGPVNAILLTNVPVVCVAPSTKISLLADVKEIKDVQEGDVLMSGKVVKKIVKVDYSDPIDIIRFKKGDLVGLGDEDLLVTPGHSIVLEDGTSKKAKYLGGAMEKYVGCVYNLICDDEEVMEANGTKLLTMGV